MPRVSAEHKERRRQAILDAAMEVFIGKGYQLATINDISNQCGLSVGALYRYFPTKGEIMLALVAERLGRAPRTFARLTAKEEDPWERMVHCVNLFTSALGVRHPTTGRLLLVTLAEAVHDNEVRTGLHSRFQGLREYLTEIVADGIAKGVFRPDANADAVATVLLFLADGGTVYWVTGTPDLDLRALRSTMIAMLRSYLFAKE
jgi:AcrR family transcriptional regulator